jgi:hypothetical protein
MSLWAKLVKKIYECQYCKEDTRSSKCCGVRYMPDRTD